MFPEKTTILAVDDDPIFIQYLNVLFTEEVRGFELRSALRGQEALQIVQETSPDLILLDILLPYIDGYTICKQIRQTSRVPIIILSNKCEDKDKLAGFQAGADDYIVKLTSPEELRDIDVEALHLYYLDEVTHQWVLVPDSYFDQSTQILTSRVDHFTDYGVIGPSLTSGPGRILANEVDLHSGTANFSYPFELPPGRGGFKPKLELTYHSSTVDEMKDRRATSSWVGIGWSLSLGSISYDLQTGLYYLELNGTSYELATSDNTNFKTNPDQYYKISFASNTWDLYDRDGNHYCFGGTSDSRQYVYNNSIRTYYRWDLSLMEDTNCNQATVTYTQEIRDSAPNDTVRSAYPQHLRYNNNLIDVYFGLGWDFYDATDGYLRYDNPQSYINPDPPYNIINPAPKIMETRMLRYIEVWVNSSLLRKYGFSYNDYADTYSSDYGGINYAGQNRLRAVQQKGADDSSTLPEMSFSYTSQRIYRNAASPEDTYSGNPGNPATINWYYLTGIDSGYGGSVSFTYTEKPTGNPTGIWTREIVTGKTVDPGIGPTETYT